MVPQAQTRPVLIALVWLAGLGAAAQFGKIAVALPDFRAVYPVSEVALGYLISCVGTVGLLFGVLGGALLGRIGIRRAMVAGLFCAGILSLLQAGLPSFPLMIALRIVEGIAHLAIVIAGPILMARHSALQHRGAVMTLWSAFFGVSYMLIALVAPSLIAWVNTGGYLAAHGLYMIALGAALWLALPPPERARTAELNMPDLRIKALFALHKKIYSSPQLSAAALGFVCYTILYIALLTYLPEFAATARRAGLSASMPLVSILTSLTLGVWLLGRMDAVRAVQLGFVATGLSAVTLIMTVGTPWFHYAALLVLGATGFVPGASFAALTALNEADEDRALATGALAQMGNVGTTTGPPLLAGILSFSGLAGLVAFVMIFSCAGIAIHQIQTRRRAAMAN